MTIELKTQRDVEVWNAAIEKAAIDVSRLAPWIVANEIMADEIRRLKITIIVGKSDYSTELDKAIEDEMKHKPKDIMK